MQQLSSQHSIPDHWTETEFDALVAALSRRQLIVSSAAAGMLVSITGLRGQAQDATPSAGMRTVQTGNGPVDVPETAMRVVCADYYSPFAVFDTSIVPIGAIEGLATNLLPEYVQSYNGADKIGTFGEPDLEKITALSPDLIVGSTDYSGAYDLLTQIAPTALFPFGGSGDWPGFAVSVADALGRGDELGRVKQVYEARAAAIASSFSSMLADTRWAIASGAEDGWWLYYPNSSHGLVFAAAGVQFVDSVAGGSDDFVSLPYEQLGMLEDADVIVVRANSDGSVDDATQALREQPLFQALPAVQAGQVYPLSALFPFSYGMATRLLDQIEVVATVANNTR